MNSNKTIIEKGLILFSSLGLVTFFFPASVYLGQFFMLTAILVYTAYFFTSKTTLNISLTVTVLMVLSSIILCGTVLQSEFAYKRSDYHTLAAIVLFFQLNNQTFVKHRNFSLTAILTSLWGFNLIFALELYLSNYDLIYNIERYFDNTGLYAIFLSLSIILLSSCHKTLNIKHSNAVAVGLFIVVLLAVVLLESRTAFILLLSYAVWEGMKFLKMSGVKYYIGGGCLLVMVVLLSFSLKINSSHGRLFVWKTTYNIIKDHPLTGIGYRNFPVVYPPRQASVYLENKMTEREIFLADNVKVAFNEYLHITAESGIVGLSALLFIIVLYLYYAPLKSMILCICIAMTFSYILHSPIIVFLIVLILSTIDIPVKIKLNRSFSTILLVVAAIFAGHSGYFLFHKYRCGVMAGTLYARAPQSMIKYYEKNEKYLCDNIRILFLMAEVSNRHNMPGEALVLLSRLDKSIRRNDIELLRARCYAKLGDYAREEECLRLSVAMCPNRFVNRYELFQFYANHHMIDKAVAEAEKIQHLDEKTVTSQSAAIKKEIAEYLENH